MTNTGGIPAGWYHAQGDPAGTFRYWDGAQWIGEPQVPAAAPGPVGQFQQPQPPHPGNRRQVAFRPPVSALPQATALPARHRLGIRKALAPTALRT